MPRKASLEPKVSTVRVPQKNGDTYILERKTVYDPEKHYNRILSSKLIAKIPKDGDKPVPTRPKRAKSASSGGETPFLMASLLGALNAAPGAISLFIILFSVGR